MKSGREDRAADFPESHKVYYRYRHRVEGVERGQVDKIPQIGKPGARLHHQHDHTAHRNGQQEQKELENKAVK